MNLNLALVGSKSDFLFAAKTSIKSVYSTTRIKNLLLASLERMALRANINMKIAGVCGFRFEGITTATLHCNNRVFWVYICLH